MGKLDRGLRGGHLVHEPLGQRLRHRTLWLLLADPGGPRGERHWCRGADRGDRHQQPLGNGIQPRQTLLHEIGDRVGHRRRFDRLTVAQRAPLVQIARELRREERVARRAGLQPCRQARRDRPANAGRNQCREAARIEALQTQLLQVACAAQAGEHARDGMPATQLPLTRGHRQHQCGVGALSSRCPSACADAASHQ